MHPKKFMDVWGVTRQELAQLIGKSPETVNRWFSDREPGFEVITLLSVINGAWKTREALDALPSHIWAFYDLVKARRATKRDQDSEV
jgi:hypothetical protein